MVDLSIDIVPNPLPLTTLCNNLQGLRLRPASAETSALPLVVATAVMSTT